MSYSFPGPHASSPIDASRPPRVAETRQQPRLRIPAAYSVVRVRPAEDSAAESDDYVWSGHIYDVSLSGMRFELDDPLDPGTRVDVRGLLPGSAHVQFRATGRVVRYHDEGPEPGPTRMGMVFEHFSTRTDEHRLREYLSDAGVRLAA